MASVALLPTELIECILDHLLDNTTTLRNCALVAKAWAPASQRGIFHHIVLSCTSPHHEDYTALTDARKRKNEKLVGFFDANPRLASYVRSLELRHFDKAPQSPGTEYHEMNASAVQVIRRLTQLDSLSLFQVSWASLSSDLQDALADAFCSDSLRQISLAYFAVPSFVELISLLSRPKNLKELKIIFLSYPDRHLPSLPASSGSTGTQSTLAPPQSIRLDSNLHLDNVNLRAFTDWFQQSHCPIDIQNLRSLRLGRTATYDSSIAALLDHVGDSLKELELRGPDRTQHSNLIHLSSTPNLCDLTLVNVYQTDTYSPIPWVQSLFHPISADRTLPLQYLRIELNIEHIDPLLPQAAQCWEKWRSIDALLTEPKFGSLQTLHIVITSMTDSIPNSLESVLIAQFPLLVQLNKFRLEIESRPYMVPLGIRKAVALFG